MIINFTDILVFPGTIDFNQFLQMMTVKMSEKDSKEEILKAFKLFDDDDTVWIIVIPWLLILLS